METIKHIALAKVGDGIQSISDGHLWVISKITRGGEVHYRRYENGWHVGVVRRSDLDIHFVRPNIELVNKPEHK